jgi:alkanesulfonate monooxygenase SsuD/methylene tetrahydromethanopterin reductase-like flavin-dependent oxidoreductase (luciferase family)
MTAIGAVFRPQTPPELLPAVAAIADAAGVDELWLWEDSFLNGGISAAAAALASTSRLAVGIGVMPVPFRNVALAAMEIATLRRMFGERAIIGVGHGVQEWMAQVGARPESPLTLLREYVTALRALLRGEEVTVSGRYVNLDRVQLAWPPDPVPRILAGAEGPKTKALVAEVADGMILVGGTTPDAVRATREQLRAGAQLVVFVRTAPGGDGGARLELEGLTHGVSALAGSPAEVADGVRAWGDAGADSVVLQPFEEDEDAAAYMRFAGSVRAAMPRGG